MITLKDINLEVKKGEFIIIIGKIGSGKSSLLHAILNEMTYLPEDVMEQYGGKYSYLTEDEVKSIRKTIYKPDAKF
jgi:ABC-type lipoprotein export system ATPase subunit